ncbi:MAG TPA: hypothetical protein P5136_01045 [Methanofastidiosum sp.]|nr:hypothetical protein [Methanofastidiosum sp.]
MGFLLTSTIQEHCIPSSVRRDITIVETIASDLKVDPEDILLLDPYPQKEFVSDPYNRIDPENLINIGRTVFTDPPKLTVPPFPIGSFPTVSIGDLHIGHVMRTYRTAEIPNYAFQDLIETYNAHTHGPFGGEPTLRSQNQSEVRKYRLLLNDFSEMLREIERETPYKVGAIFTTDINGNVRHIESESMDQSGILYKLCARGIKDVQHLVILDLDVLMNEELQVILFKYSLMNLSK